MNELTDFCVLELVQNSLTESKMTHFLPSAENPEQALKHPNRKKYDQGTSKIQLFA